MLQKIENDERGNPADHPFENREAFDSFYHREAPKLLLFLRRRIWTEEDRADLVQEAFTRLVAAKSNAARENPGSYIQGILRHLLADRARAWARARTPLPPDAILTAEPEMPDAALELADMQALYRRAVSALPPRTRDVYMLHRAEGLGFREIAKQLGISIRTVEWHVAHAVHRIGKAVSGHD